MLRKADFRVQQFPGISNVGPPAGLWRRANVPASVSGQPSAACAQGIVPPAPLSVDAAPSIVTQLVGRELSRQLPRVLLQPLALRRARDRHDPRLSARAARRARSAPACPAFGPQTLPPIDEREIGLPVLLRNRGTTLRSPSGRRWSSRPILPVRNPLPQRTEARIRCELLESRQHLPARARGNHSEYSLCSAVTGWTAMRATDRLHAASDRPKCLTLPSRISP